MPRLRYHGRVEGEGDLMGHVAVVVPTRLDREQTELLRKLAALRGEEQPDLAAGARHDGLFSRLRDSFAARRTWSASATAPRRRCTARYGTPTWCAASS